MEGCASGRAILWDGAPNILRVLPARLREQRDLRRGFEKTSIKFGALDFLEIDGDRVGSRILVVDIADAVSGQIGTPVLVFFDFEFAFIEAYALRDEQQALSIVQTWPKRCRQVKLAKEHPDVESSVKRSAC